MSQNSVNLKGKIKNLKTKIEEKRKGTGNLFTWKPKQDALNKLIKKVENDNYKFNKKDINKLDEILGGIKKILRKNKYKKSNYNNNKKKKINAISEQLKKINRNLVMYNHRNNATETNPFLTNFTNKKIIRKIKLKVVTYNVFEWGKCAQYSKGDGFKDQIEYLKSLNSDIIGLQEVYIKEHDDNFSLKKIKEIFKDYEVIDGTFEVSWIPDGKFGNLLLIRKELLFDNSSKLFNHKKKSEDRSYNKATINIDGKSINVYNTHLEVIGKNNDYRLQQLGEILKDNGDSSCILLGDFNSFAPQNIERKQSIHNHIIRSKKTEEDMSSVYNMLIENNFIDTLTNPLTITTTKYGSRSDFIFYKKLGSVDTQTTIDSSDSNTNGLPTRSDHFPVIANFFF